MNTVLFVNTVTYIMVMSMISSNVRFCSVGRYVLN